MCTVAAPGCADDSVDDGDEVSDDNTTADDNTDNTEQTDSSSWEPIPARGNIGLTEVVVNQGVDVPIAAGPDWVGPADRNTVIIRGRDTLVRAFWEIPDGWTDREITARLEVEFPGGDTSVLEDTKLIDAQSYPGGFDSTFWWSIAADNFAAGTLFQVSLWEAEEGHEGEADSDTVILTPADGLAQIGIQPDPQELKVEFVPVSYNFGNCDTDTTDIDPAELQRFVDAIHEYNPVEEVIFNFRQDATINWEGELFSIAQLHQVLQGLRTQDGAGANVYYYALIDVCSGGIGDAAGIAAGIPPATMESAHNRVSAGVYNEDVEYSFETFVHEVGHTQGRMHTYCPGGEAAGTDPNHPIEDGTIGVWGFAIRSFKLHNPTGTYDYMSYCQPYWVGDWNWTKTYERIRTLTSWDYGAPAPGPQGEVLVGLLMDNGQERWWTTPGGVSDEQLGLATSIEFEIDGQPTVMPAHILENLDDPHVTMINAPLPSGVPSIDVVNKITRIDDQGHRHAVELTPLPSSVLPGFE